MKAENKVEACPLCGDIGNLRADLEGIGRDQYWVECENPDCAGMGPIKFEHGDAIKGWNRREDTKADTRSPERIVEGARDQGLLSPTRTQ